MIDKLSGGSIRISQIAVRFADVCETKHWRSKRRENERETSSVDGKVPKLFFGSSQTSLFGIKGQKENW